MRDFAVNRRVREGQKEEGQKEERQKEREANKDSAGTERPRRNYR